MTISAEQRHQTWPRCRFEASISAHPFERAVALDELRQPRSGSAVLLVVVDRESP
jgi:hypothetical protein